MHFSLIQLIFLIAVRFTQGVSKNFEKKPGPCTFGTHPDSRQLKCADNGYFEVRQCLAEYCVCVDPRSGHEAAATRTASARVEPRCGKCHLALARMLAAANSSPKLPPQCEPNTGDYQPKQCQSDQNCLCVNRETGEPLAAAANSRAAARSSAELTCGEQPRVSASIDARPAAAASSAKSGASSPPPATSDAPSADYPPVGSPVCRLPKDAGRPCGDGRTASSVQWYFDVDSFECLAFRHNGCGGNANHFYSVSECWSQCKLADFGACAGLKSPAKDAKGENIVCYSHSGIEGAKCPPDYRCTMLAFFGICCHEATQELYRRNYLPSCTNRKSVKKIESGGVPMTLIGKSCEDDFCPRNSTCHKQEIFAHCCQ